MKQSPLVKAYALILLVIFGGIVLHAPLSVAFGTMFTEIDLLIKSWKEMLLLVAAPIGAWLLWRQGMVVAVIKDQITQVAAAYLVLHAIMAAVLQTGPMATLAGLAIDVRHILFFLLVLILVKLAPQYKRVFLRVGLVGAVVVIGFGVMQLFLPADILAHIGYSEDTILPYMTVDENPDYIRINSTMRGPNPLGAYIVILSSVLAAYVMRRKVDLRQPRTILVLGVSAVSVLAVLWATFSRSAVVATGLGVLLAVAIAGKHLISRRVWIAGFIVVFALLGGVIAGRDTAFVENVILHENSESDSPVSSNEEHFTSLGEGLDRMIRQPAGAGLAAPARHRS